MGLSRLESGGFFALTWRESDHFRKSLFKFRSGFGIIPTSGYSMKTFIGTWPGCKICYVHSLYIIPRATPRRAVNNDNSGGKNKNLFWSISALGKRDTRPYILYELLLIIAVFSAKYVCDDSLFCPAAAAPYKAINMVEIRIEPDIVGPFKRKLLAARNL